MTIRRFTVRLDIDGKIDEDVLLSYLVDGIATMRGCYAPDSPVHNFKLLSIESFKSIQETVEPTYGYGHRLTPEEMARALGE